MCAVVSAYTQVCEAVRESQLGDKRRGSTKDRRDRVKERLGTERKLRLFSFPFSDFPPVSAPTQQGGVDYKDTCDCMCVCVREREHSDEFQR